MANTSRSLDILFGKTSTIVLVNENVSLINLFNWMTDSGNANLDNNILIVNNLSSILPVMIDIVELPSNKKFSASATLVKHLVMIFTITPMDPLINNTKILTPTIHE